MNDRKRNRKYILFLIFLGGFGYILYANLSNKTILKEVSDINVQTKTSVSIDNPTGVTVPKCGNIQNDVSPELVTDYITLDLEKPIDITEAVLAGTDSSCESFSKQFDISAMCEEGSASSEVEGGANNAGVTYANKSGGEIDVSDDVRIRLVEVTFPAQFWNGSKVVKDSTLGISKANKDPVYNSSGDYLALEYGQTMLTPAQAEAFKNVEGNNREAFSVIARNKIVASEEKENIKGTYIVEKETNEPYKSLCPTNIQNSAFNPTGTNEVGRILNDSLQIPGGDPDLDATVTSCVETNDTITYTMNDSNMYDTVCSETGLWANFLGRVRAFFSQDEWTDCTVSRLIDLGNGETESEDDACKTKEDIVVEMTSVYGAVDDCVDGVCGNAGMTKRFLLTQSPSQSTTFEIGSPSSKTSLTRAILTPCIVEIQTGFFWNNERVPVYCKWDATPNLANYRAQQVEKIPGDETYYSTYDEYWRDVVTALTKHSELSAL